MFTLPLVDLKLLIKVPHIKGEARANNAKPTALDSRVAMETTEK